LVELSLSVFSVGLAFLNCIIRNQNRHVETQVHHTSSADTYYCGWILYLYLRLRNLSFGRCPSNFSCGNFTNELNFHRVCCGYVQSVFKCKSDSLVNGSFQDLNLSYLVLSIVKLEKFLI
jgi:hypothetical protein